MNKTHQDKAEVELRLPTWNAFTIVNCSKSTILWEACVCCNNGQWVLETCVYDRRKFPLRRLLGLFSHLGSDGSFSFFPEGSSDVRRRHWHKCVEKMCVDRRAFSISNRWPPNEQPHSQQMRAEQNSVKSRAWSQQDHQMSQQATALLFHSSGVLYPKEKRWGEVRWDEESLQVNAGGDPKPPVHWVRINKEGWWVTSR